MAKKILVTGATGNQGGSVVKLLLQYPEQYAVRALTRNPSSPTAKRLADKGVEVVKGDLTDPATLPTAFNGCWGAFVVTNFYDSNAAKAALEAGLQCFVWSTLPSSLKISKGEVCCEIYEGKHRVDDFIRGINLPAAFVYTGNFYENMILRGHVRKSEDGKGLEFRQPIIQANTRLHMLWVQRDLGVIVKAILDNWDTRKKDLVYQHFYAMDAIHTPTEVCSTIESVTGTPTKYVVLPNTGNESRDIMFTLYNRTGTYPGVQLPDPKVLDLGVELHGLEEFIREDLVPHLKASGDLQA
ncbi:hypothetical protein LTR10_016062 [Elasticomyces elasticus]|uniref:NmrA-like domain-containing protein n=1 Tax=Exophiala sideris TaxID=1016849 RepID=A0ABR0J3G7_9EURO|nr:hypothetical protein LTR10_016062 [Elasticomyces elasticus]KAK5024601.1 hypothetical protein LTS07_008447 [Exophiala sideris]KAK5030694.1 hypothetical protein LTR13_008048 [Exophiala sideris]KAK5054234.1 hypothetical protein LTR69_008849 [Exophiala sideris]KAK5179636.1 hypothetical protein LTR44_007804 [Eurotiomycetes sp. CCFEE 6388]